MKPPALLAAAALLVFAPRLGAEGAGRVRIVTAADLVAELPSAVVLDARGEGDFRAGHIPGSHAVDWRDWTEERLGAFSALFGTPARWGRVPPADEMLQSRLRALGLSNARPIVVVGTPGAWGEEGRIAWNLLYWGAEDVALLDGGFAAWAALPGKGEAGQRKAEGKKEKPGDFVLRIRPERRIEAAALKAALDSKSRPILDARTPEEYAGKRETGQKRGGHLPGARLVPEKSLYRADGRYVDAAELKKMTGISDGGPPPAVYCVGGVRSALLALLLEARLGVLASNYDGSIWEWAADPSLPLETK